MKILICDDDISTVDVIKQHIPWEDLGINQILSAYNGIDAKNVIASERPEIILSDIGMPLCNGVDVLKYVREIGLKSEFIFLTCYESFEFAREAVRYGANRYLTKPLNLPELEDELRQVINVAKTQFQEKSLPVQKSREQYMVVNSILRGLRDNMYGTDPKLLEASLRKHKLSVKADDRFRCILVYGETSEALSKTWTTESLCYSFSYLSQEVIAERMDFKNFIIDNQETTIQLLTFVPAEKATESELLERCQRFCTIAYAYTGVSPVCLIGDEMPLYMTYAETTKLQSKLNRIRFQKGRAFLPQDILSIHPPVHLDLDEAQLLNYLKRQDKPGYLRFITSYIHQLSSGNRDSGLQMTLLHHALLQAFYQCIRDNRIHPNMIFTDDDMRDADSKAERSSYDMIRFAGVLFDRVQQLLSKNADTYNTLEAAKQYIQDHFRENIDREAIANVACITPNYLSKRFHAETGMSLREYVNQLRIAEAKRLLLSTNKSVSEIAGEVGFDNISYFSTVFRKLCGISPIDWKNGKHDN